jgi:putative Mn2+ efflux pump MntP
LAIVHVFAATVSAAIAPAFAVFAVDAAPDAPAFATFAAVFAVTAVSVVLGILGGSRIGARFGRSSEIAGGVVLILIALWNLFR